MFHRRYRNHSAIACSTKMYLERHFSWVLNLSLSIFVAESPSYITRLDLTPCEDTRPHMEWAVLCKSPKQVSRLDLPDARKKGEQQLLIYGAPACLCAHCAPLSLPFSNFNLFILTPQPTQTHLTHLPALLLCRLFLFPSNLLFSPGIVSLTWNFLRATKYCILRRTLTADLWAWDNLQG